MGAVTIIKYLVFVFNFLFFLTGCGLLGVGIWLNVERADWEEISDYDYISVANVAIAAGAIIIIVAFLGCCGAITENKIMLLIFFVFLLIIFFMEIGAGIAAYVWRDEVEDELLEQVRKRIPERYWAEEGIKKAVDEVQDHFDCCGVDTWRDWGNNTNPHMPKSCCKEGISNCDKMSYALVITNPAEQAKYVTNKPCYPEIKDFVKDNLLYIGICAIVFGVFQVLGMIFAMVLFLHIRNENRTV